MLCWQQLKLRNEDCVGFPTCFSRFTGFWNSQQPTLSYNFLASLNHYFNKNNKEKPKLLWTLWSFIQRDGKWIANQYTYPYLWGCLMVSFLWNSEQRNFVVSLCVNDLIVSPFIMNSESKISLTTRYWFYFFYPITLHFVSTLIILYFTPRSHDIPGYCLSTLDELGFDVHMPHVTIALRTAAVLAIPVPLHLLLVPGIFSNCIDQTSHVPSAFDKTISLICINAKKS